MCVYVCMCVCVCVCVYKKITYTLNIFEHQMRYVDMKQNVSRNRMLNFFFFNFSFHFKNKIKYNSENTSHINCTDDG